MDESLIKMSILIPNKICTTLKQIVILQLKKTSRMLGMFFGKLELLTLLFHLNYIEILSHVIVNHYTICNFSRKNNIFYLTKICGHTVSCITIRGIDNFVSGIFEQIHYHTQASTEIHFFYLIIVH